MTAAPRLYFLFDGNGLRSRPRVSLICSGARAATHCRLSERMCWDLAAQQIESTPGATCGMHRRARLLSLALKRLGTGVVDALRDHRWWAHEDAMPWCAGEVLPAAYHARMPPLRLVQLHACTSTNEQCTHGSHLISATSHLSRSLARTLALALAPSHLPRRSTG